MALRRLTDQEIRERADELAQLHARYDAVEEQKKEQAKELGEQLKELRSRMQRLAAEIRDKHTQADQETIQFGFGRAQGDE